MVVLRPSLYALWPHSELPPFACRRVVRNTSLPHFFDGTHVATTLERLDSCCHYGWAANRVRLRDEYDGCGVRSLCYWLAVDGPALVSADPPNWSIDQSGRGRPGARSR